MVLVQSTSLRGVGQLICVVILFLFVLFLAYIAARLAGGLQSNMMNKRSNIRVIEVFRISNNQVIEIVQIGSRYFALAVCKESISVLSELQADEIKEHEASLEPINFKNILDKIKNEKQEKDNTN